MRRTEGSQKWRSGQFRGRIIALWLSSVTERVRGREVEEKRATRHSHPLCVTYPAGYLVSHLRRNLRIWLDIPGRTRVKRTRCALGMRQSASYGRKRVHLRQKNIFIQKTTRRAVRARGWKNIAMAEQFYSKSVVLYSTRGSAKI